MNVVILFLTKFSSSANRYVDVAKAAGVPCRCFVMQCSAEHCQHNERVSTKRFLRITKCFKVYVDIPLI